MKTNLLSSLTEQLNTVPASLALGNFDGLHLGHQALFETVINSDLYPSVFTFEDRSEDLITPLGEKTAFLETIGMKSLFVAPFSLFRDLSPEQFVDWLYDKLTCRHIVVGFNFRFGKHAVGNTQTLRVLAAAKGIKLTVVEPVLLENEPISASRIRAALKRGDMEEATAALGRPYSLSGTVMKGYGIGKTLFFPTINLDCKKEIVLCHGVYFTRAEIDGVTHFAITNIGKNPTFDRKIVSCESHLLDFEGNLYEKQVTLFFDAYRRAEKTFPDKEALKNEVFADIAAAKAFYGILP